jgi:hypothetical protein
MGNKLKFWAVVVAVVAAMASAGAHRLEEMVAPIITLEQQ